jgi:hypothetical protein
MKCPVESRNGSPRRTQLPGRRGLRLFDPEAGAVRFSDELPPPLRGVVGGVAVALHVWPPDVVPSHAEAFRPCSGVLAGCWVLLRFP